MDTNCLFCKIIDGAIPSYKIYEDADTLAFLTIGPHTKGHTLVVPKKHSSSVYDIEEDDLYKTILSTQKVAKHIKDILKADGINIGQNNDRAAGQEVFHTHFHIIPRYQDDGYKHWPIQPITQEDLQKLQSMIAMI